MLRLAVPGRGGQPQAERAPLPARGTTRSEQQHSTVTAQSRSIQLLSRAARLSAQPTVLTPGHEQEGSSSSRDLISLGKKPRGREAGNRTVLPEVPQSGWAEDQGCRQPAPPQPRHTSTGMWCYFKESFYSTSCYY